MTVIDRIAAFHDDLAALRRDFHAHPEIGFEEHRTSDIVAAKLAEYGVEVHRNIGGTGVVGVLRNGNSHRSVGLRSDMDALPIHEATGKPWASLKPGTMHACGHDGHMTMLLGAARYLAETRAFDGTVHFIFQPAEEGLGGAKAMLADGLFERFPCDAVFGMHNAPGLAKGRFSIRPGAMMAGGAFFDIDVAGRGAHGARPEASIDPVLAAAHIATAIQSIVARNVPATEHAVLSVTAIHSGDAYNVIPDSAQMRGTARCFSHAGMDVLRRGLERVAVNVAAGLGATAEVDFREIFAPVVNDPAETQAIADVAASLVGDDAVSREQPLILASEDFSYMLEARPGAFINIGHGDSAQVHNPAYDFDDAVIPLGASLWARLAEAKLGRMPG
ncbi:M20 family metallopeptidase [Alsobacter sp. SYSU M60028]|uniref:M20 family metallopeptidase n=1 Tax=Alsobacter ponti TaxID=2962936 RepID=A0ABT1L781_9HYPH|nr:M20 aminoacylase family protein [Alsobacter ponti]MCP8937309.1 M20 family metallopeptidase [Alsobacter ponti]